MPDFINSLWFQVLNSISTFWVLFTLLSLVYGMFVGITPVVFRLGTALWKRKIAIFGDDSSITALATVLLDSKVFKEKNIVRILPDNIEKAKDVTIYLVDWKTYGVKIDEIITFRKHQTPLIIFAKPKTIDDVTMDTITNRPNTVVVNSKGRLLNDILTSLITTSFDGK